MSAAVSADEDLNVLYRKADAEVDVDEEVKSFLAKKVEKQSQKQANGKKKDTKRQRKKKKKVEDAVQPFLDESVEVKRKMDELNDDIRDINTLYGQLISEANPETEAVLRNNIVGQRHKIEQAIASIRDRLRELKDETSSRHEHDTVTRVRVNMVSALGKELMQVAQDYRQTLAKWEERQKRRAVRQVRIVDPSLEEAEISAALESDQVEQLFAQQTLRDRKGEQTLDFLQEKRSDLYLLEKSIAEVQQTFLDLSLLVESADDTLNTIEAQVLQTKSWTEKATSQLRATKRFVLDKRKKKLLIIVVCGVILVIVAGIIIGIVLAIALL